MKTKQLLLTALIAAALVWACKSAPTPEEEQQEEVNLSFENVYNKYKDRLILTDSADYVVKAGDTLNRIARQFYGSKKDFGVSNAYFFPLIMLASNEVVLDPDLIEPGMTLSVPDLQRNLDNADARQAMKEFFREIAAIYGEKAGAATRPNLRTLAEETQQSLLELVQSL
jgi:LysM repeat protein